MKSIRLLHVTDFHFGKESDYKNTADLKDGNVPKKLTNNLNSDWTEEFFNCVNEWSLAHNTKIDSIICTGDIGDQGKQKNIELGALFLDKLCTRLELDKADLYLCPGNHDLERKKVRSEFKVYEDILNKYSINNYSSYDSSFTTTIKDIPLISLNSCLGGTAKSGFSVKFNKILENIPDVHRNEITEELEKLGQNYLSDFLDVPAIGNKQLENTLEYISKNNSDSAIILMHHNPVPNNSIEVRPYGSMVDSGKFITKVLNTKKKAFILHGHTHFDYDILSYFPNGDDNYVSAIGCGALNDTANGRANIYEFYYTNDNKHIITKVYRIQRIGSASFGIQHSHNIYDKGFTELDAPIMIEMFKVRSSVLFSDLLLNLKNKGVDEISLLKVILKQEYLLINIDKKNTDDYHKWCIIKKNN
ncbi:hypothetical protein EMN47_20110 [Prolixibacteraceae bacterium JC049]|nr:hypothetical protein [Prolixibacteraceae bacterium JC049]